MHTLHLHSQQPRGVQPRHQAASACSFGLKHVSIQSCRINSVHISTVEGVSGHVVRKRQRQHVSARSTLATPYTQQQQIYQHEYALLSSQDDELGWRTDFNRHFKNVQEIGSGSFGRVYRAVDLHTGTEVAVKILPKVRGKLSREKTLEKIAREVDILERLQGSCAGIISLLDVFETSDDVLIVTELCAGGDLQNYSEAHGPFQERALAHVALEVLKIIRSCHQAGILHGDVKPANFTLKHKHHNPLEHPYGNFTDYYHTTSTSWLRAIDYGCSQLLPGQRRLSKRSGTPVYMSPEIYARDYYTEADMWSLGVMLYQLYAKRFPFWHDMESCRNSKLEEVAAAVATAPITFDYGPWLHMSEEGRHFVATCLSRDPSQRMTVEQAFEHPWLRRQLAGPPPVPASVPQSAVRAHNLQ